MESHKGLLYPGLLRMNEGRVTKVWKLFMAFAMKGGGSCVSFTSFQKWFFVKTI